MNFLCRNELALKQLTVHEVIVHRVGGDFGHFLVLELDEGVPFGAAGARGTGETKTGH